MPNFAFDAYVGECGFDAIGRAWFALGDGRVCDETGGSAQAHDGAILCAATDPGGRGVLSGGEDGRLVLTRGDGGVEEIHARPGRWIDALAVAPTGALFAFATGRDVQVRDAANPVWAAGFTHERSAAALAFDPKGRRLAVAGYGGVTLWYARIADQKPQMLKWAGSHIAVAWSPDGRFVLSAMQENALHGWRLADAKDMRMGGYPAKPRSLAFLSRGRTMATSGAAGAVLWPFAGADGPMGKSASEIAAKDEGLVTRVAAARTAERLVIGRSDGAVTLFELTSGHARELASATGAPVSALAVSADGARVAFGDEAGAAGVAAIQRPDSAQHSENV